MTVSSEDANGSVLNQVEYHYDSNGNADKEYQEHDGVVNTGTSLYVGYGYDTAANGYRPTTLQYPTVDGASSRVLTDSYGAYRQHGRRDRPARRDHRRQRHNDERHHN